MPLWDEHHGQIAGMLTASDFMLILLKVIHVSGTAMNEMPSDFNLVKPDSEMIHSCIEAKKQCL